MHIPDGYLSAPVWATMDGVAVGTIALALKNTSKNLEERKVPIMGLMGAFIFAAQMINFPIGGGTSGHLVGGVLVASLLGMGPAILVMTTVFVVQALFFGDGGLLSLGANLFNMGIVGCVFGGLGSVWDHRGSREEISFAGRGVAAWLAVVTGAVLTSLELGISGTAPLRLLLPPMAGVHAIIGIGEAVITVAVLNFVHSSKVQGLLERKVRIKREV